MDPVDIERTKMIRVQPDIIMVAVAIIIAFVMSDISVRQST